MNNNTDPQDKLNKNKRKYDLGKVWGVTINVRENMRIIGKRHGNRAIIEDLVIETLKEAGRNFKFLTINEIIAEINRKKTLRNLIIAKPVTYNKVYDILRKYRILHNQNRSDTKGFPRPYTDERDGMKVLVFEWIE
jgi:hypothetical protein